MRRLVLVTLTHAAVFAQPTRAAQLQPSAVFRRCFAQLTQTRPEPSDPLLKKVTAGEITAKEACGRLLDDAIFDESGLMTGKTNIAILNTLHSFHASWLRLKDWDLTRDPRNNIVINKTAEPTD